MALVQRLVHNCSVCDLGSVTAVACPQNAGNAAGLTAAVGTTSDICAGVLCCGPSVMEPGVLLLGLPNRGLA
jgi:hypothetical protein